jgi:uncharacterized protein (UPF0261 family)
MDLTSRRPIALIGTLDTKGDEILFLKETLSTLGCDVFVIDVGVQGEPSFQPDVTREEIAAKAGARIDDLVARGDRGVAIETMALGLAAWFRSRVSTISGLLAIGGSAGTSIATAAMRELPTGVPKLMVSTLASGNTRPYVGNSDIAMLYPVADFTGLNRLTRTVLTNAANAIAGMCCLRLPQPETSSSRPTVAATMFGVTTPCVNRIRALLEDAGFEALVFHATGTGGEAMEQLIRDGFIHAVADITTTELADELVGGVLSAGPHRLEAAGIAGLPQVISVGALDMVNFGPADSVPDKFRGRTFYQHNPSVTLMRTTKEEAATLGRMVAEKANAGRGDVAILLPLRGVSAIDADGQPFYDPEADGAMFDAIRSTARVRLIEMDAHINDPEFATRAASELIEMTRRSGVAPSGSASVPS